MNQTYACKHCGAESPTVFLVMLHIFTHHLHINIGLPACESKLLLEKCVEYDKGYYKMLYETLPKISTWDERN